MMAHVVAVAWHATGLYAVLQLHMQHRHACTAADVPSTHAGSALLQRSMLLPYMLAGVNAASVADYRAASYMILGQLASKATFSGDLLSGGLAHLGLCSNVWCRPACVWQ